ncbi:AGAP013383-PA [Anopheles gambiae str. PEST]|uniref:AGAP013383-PA n=1 Tax=Anopheles gambiae TaxID=7165 RepID=F5HKE7_ANOGA|nr:AGAP013383-PA [Anopheles gambiae str. PEST]
MYIAQGVSLDRSVSLRERDAAIGLPEALAAEAGAGLRHSKNGNTRVGFCCDATVSEAQPATLYSPSSEFLPVAAEQRWLTLQQLRNVTRHKKTRLVCRAGWSVFFCFC